MRGDFGLFFLKCHYFKFQHNFLKPVRPGPYILNFLKSKPNLNFIKII